MIDLSQNPHSFPTLFLIRVCSFAFERGKMAYIRLAIILVCFLAANGSAKSRGSDLEAKVDLLSSKIAKIEEENLQLRQSVVDSSSSYLAFDCFRESSLSTNGIIPFDGCDGTKLLNTLLTVFSDTSLLIQ